MKSKILLLLPLCISLCSFKSDDIISKSFLVSLKEDNQNIISSKNIKDFKRISNEFNTFCLYKVVIEDTLNSINKWIEEISSNAKVNYIEEESYGKQGSNDFSYSSMETHLTALNIVDAWKYSQGNKELRIGVIDSGIDGDHPELIDNIDKDLSIKFKSDSLIDTDGHGTHVAGIIGASGNYANVKGVAPHIKLVSLKVDLDENNNWTTSSVISAINFANSNNINILNFSGRDFGYSESLKNTIKDYNGLFITIAGNKGKDLDNYERPYPAKFNLDNMIVVGNCTNNGSFVSGSNYSSKYVDLFAPGENIFSTYLDGTYKEMGGTSMAGPVVSGAVALLKSIYPNKSNQFIKGRIINNTDEKTSLNGKCKSNGILNINKAIHPSCSYDYSYSTYNETYHKAICLCGNYELKSHIIAASEIIGGKLYSTCLYCNAKIEKELLSLANTENSMDFEYINGKYYIKETKYIDDILYLSYGDYLNYEI